MDKKQFFSIGSFAKLSRTTKDTLRHYDSIGALPPAIRMGNGYRYYSLAQLAVVNVIRILQELGMSLEEINEIKDRRSPEFLDELYIDQVGKIDAKINDWVRARKLLLTLRENIHSVLTADEQTITVRYMPAQAIILGGLNDYSGNRNPYSALLDFYEGMSSTYPDLDMNYPVWGLFPKERIMRGDWRWPERYYFSNPAGHDKIPAALYAVGYTRGGYGQTDELYKRMISYIAEAGFEICGNVYEEYPLNELSIPDSGNYLIRIMMTVHENKQIRQK